MAESVDALVSNTSGAIRAGSIPAPGTRNPRRMRSARVFLLFSPHFPHIFLAPSGWDGLSRIAPYFHILSMKMAAFMDKVQFLVGLSMKSGCFMDGWVSRRGLSMKMAAFMDKVQFLMGLSMKMACFMDSGRHWSRMGLVRRRWWRRSGGVGGGGGVGALWGGVRR